MRQAAEASRPLRCPRCAWPFPSANLMSVPRSTPRARLRRQRQAHRSTCAAAGAASSGQSALPSWLFLRRVFANTDEFGTRRLLELESLHWNVFIQPQLGDLQVQPVIIVWSIDLNHAGKKSDPGCGSRCLILVAGKRLPIGVAHV